MIEIKSTLHRPNGKIAPLGSVKFENWNKAKLGGRGINNYAVMCLKKEGKFTVDYPGGAKVIYEVVEMIPEKAPPRKRLKK